jgi:hypothetical protein
MTRFDGRRTFSDPPKASELNEFAGDVVRKLENPDGARRWTMLPVARGDAAALLTTASAAFDATLPVDTSNGAIISVQFPPADSRHGGRELSIIRKSTTGAIRLIMPNGSDLNGSPAVATMPTAVGRYTYQFDGADFWGEA